MLQASFHQGDSRFRGNGRQCMANSLVALVHHSKENISKWTVETLNSILHEGDDLYLDISQNQGVDYLMLNNLPKIVHNVSINLTTPVAGSVNRSSSEPPFYNLEGAFSHLEEKSHSYTGYILTIGKSTPCYTMAVIRSNEQYYLVDSHSRSENGMVSGNGKATITLHNSLFVLCLFLKHLTNLLFNQNEVPFEIAAVSSYDISELKTLDFGDSEFEVASESESEFSGFDSSDVIDESILQTKIHMLNNSLEMEMLSEVSSISSGDLDFIEQSMVNLDDSAVFFKSVDISFSDNDDHITPDEQTEPLFENKLKENIDINMSPEETEDTIESCEPFCEASEVFNEKDVNLNENIDKNTDTSIDQEDETYDDDLDQNFTISENQTSSTDDENLLPLSYIKKRNQRQQKRQKILMKRTIINDTDLNVNNADSSTEELSDVDAIVAHINESNNNYKQRGRKRVRNEQNWKRNIAKKRRNEGLSYVSRNHTVKSSRMMKPPCGSQCKYKCTAKFTENDREKIFHTYWGLGNLTKQRQFLLRYTSKKQKMRNKYKITRRENSISWSLPSIDYNASVKVCKTFFLNTLSISDQMVITAQKNQKVGVIQEDGRGKANGSRSNKISPDRLEQVYQHIKCFPTVESHYCRKDSIRQYLNPGLSVSKMYDLYLDFCQGKHLQPVTLFQYRHIFNTQFNLGFLKPKKDQCDLCNSFKNARNTDKDIMQNEYRIHIENKQIARENKERDKKRTLTDLELCVACFDLEQVLVTPKGFESCLYYKRQLNNYNFTLYDLGNKDGFSYLWNESIAGRGASEIASCIYHFIQFKASEGKRKFIFYSDNCIPQNKNRYYVSMLWYCLKKYNLSSIEHKYLEKGHTYNENDSVHSSIENTSKNISIYTTGQWAACIRSSRRKHPYIVKEMSLGDFYDFKVVADRLNNFEFDTSRQKVYWNGIRLLTLSSDNQDHFVFKYEYNGPAYSVGLLNRQRRSHYCSDVPDPKSMQLSRLRDDFIPISINKYNDLVSLCLSDVIPKVHHIFYVLLPHL